MSHRIARDVTVDRVHGTLTIDGHVFPYAVLADIVVEGGELPVVRLGLLADNARVVTVEGEAVYANPWPSTLQSTEGTEPCC